jgi:hypothetical protein
MPPSPAAVPVRRALRKSADEANGGISGSLLHGLE